MVPIANIIEPDNKTILRPFVSVSLPINGRAIKETVVAAVVTTPLYRAGPPNADTYTETLPVKIKLATIVNVDAAHKNIKYLFQSFTENCCSKV